MEKPFVGIIMGSDSDLEVMKPASDVLTELGVPNELRVVSAHRTPHRAMQYAQDAEGRGLKVIIAGAGGAAHLPGVTAALTPLPVVGVPVLGKSLNGLDSLLSIVQMPAGVPVATVGVNASKNAGLLAAQMIALGDPALAGRLKAWRKANEEKVAAVDERWRQAQPTATPRPN
jgi:5-(carboxyamino)imidazole ribonucleotide mutase